MILSVLERPLSSSLIVSRMRTGGFCRPRRLNSERNYCTPPNVGTDSGAALALIETIGAALIERLANRVCFHSPHGPELYDSQRRMAQRAGDATLSIDTVRPPRQ